MAYNSHIANDSIPTMNAPYSNVSVNSIFDTDLRNESRKKMSFPSTINEVTKWLAVGILVGILVFNSTILILLLRKKQNSRMAFFVQNLAIADFCVGLIYVLPEVIIFRFHIGWTRYACYILYGVKMFPIYVSTFAIITLTLDRLYVIRRPISSSGRGVKYRVSLIVTTWVLAILLSLPYMVCVRFNNGKCRHDFGNSKKVMLMFDISLILILPVLIIGACYISIVVTICRRERNILLNENIRRSLNSTHKNDGKTRSTRKPLIAQAKIRTIKLLLIIVTAYIVCWTPVCVGTSLLMWKHIEFGVTFQLLYVLAPLNSLVNPFVFLVFHRKIFKRKEFGTYRFNPSGTLKTSIFTNGTRTQAIP
ncbi:mesotocin receptor-like isoform X2 [Mytilus californianus]|uniref:mesotocin receptor-like isoform X2 n=1 Tax=Mytilus californianus TaxID=6549 RepID=UPI0022471668|nr:mesotocin receptor-like isoform X2 [Mytilus californianus]